MNIRRRYRLITEWSYNDMKVFYLPQKKIETLCGLKWTSLTGLIYESKEDAKNAIQRSKDEKEFKSKIISRK